MMIMSKEERSHRRFLVKPSLAAHKKKTRLLLLLLVVLLAAAAFVLVPSSSFSPFHYHHHDDNNEGNLSSSSNAAAGTGTGKHQQAKDDTQPQQHRRTKTKDEEEKEEETPVSKLNSPVVDDGSIPRRPHTVRLDFDVLKKLHVGKAGGGTIEERMSRYRLDITRCHPYPCWWHDNDDPAFPLEETIEDTSSPSPALPAKEPYRLISIRDPIDRFNSAFYWRAWEVCDPAKGKQKKKGGKNHHRELHNCKWPRFRDEANILWVKYQHNASLLGENFCDNRQEAVQDLKEIQHAQFSTKDWLITEQGDDEQEEQELDRKAPNLYVMVLEHGALSLEGQFNGAIRWVYDNLKFESAKNFQNRERYVMYKDRHPTKPPRNEHKSNKVPLTERATKCLREYFQFEYDFFKMLQTKACKADECVNGIQMILDRRSVD